VRSAFARASSFGSSDRRRLSSAASTSTGIAASDRLAADETRPPGEDVLRARRVAGRPDDFLVEGFAIGVN
jgi:hypothetical protein